MSSTGSDGKTYEMACLHLDTLPMWLATIQAGRVKPALRAKLARYKCEAAKVLAAHFLPREAPPASPVSSAPSGGCGRIGDTPEGHLRVKTSARNAAYGARISIQRAYGRIRQFANVISPYRVPVSEWPAVERHLYEISLGLVVIQTRKQLAARKANVRQLHLVGVPA